MSAPAPAIVPSTPGLVAPATPVMPKSGAATPPSAPIPLPPPRSRARDKTGQSVPDHHLPGVLRIHPWLRKSAP